MRFLNLFFLGSFLFSSKTVDFGTLRNPARPKMESQIGQVASKSYKKTSVLHITAGSGTIIFLESIPIDF